MRDGIRAQTSGDRLLGRLRFQQVLESAEADSEPYRIAAKLTRLDEQFIEITYDERVFYLLAPVGRNPGLVVKRGSFQEWPTLTWLRENLPLHKTVLDIGCNIGNHSLFFWHYLETSDIYGFDPAPTTAYFYCQNVPEAKLFNIALGNEGETVVLVGDILNKNFSQARILSEPTTRADRKEIRTRSVDSFGFKNVTLMKIDVESWELAVLSGGMETIKRDKPAIMIEFLPENRAEYDEFFARHLPEYRRAHTVETEDSGRQDIIFVAN